MAGNTNIVKQAVQLADDGGDLLGEVARVHGDCRPASGVFNSACTLPAWNAFPIASRRWRCSRQARNARVHKMLVSAK